MENNAEYMLGRVSEYAKKQLAPMEAVCFQYYLYRFLSLLAPVSLNFFRLYQEKRASSKWQNGVTIRLRLAGAN